MDISDPWNHLAESHVATGRIRATIYRRGAILEGWPSRWPQRASGCTARRGIITSQSARSLIRAAFAIRAAEVDWKYMLTLTFRNRIQAHKDAMRWFFKLMWRGKANRLGLAWFLEYQDRGVEHYHVLMDESALQELVWSTMPTWRTVRRRGQGVRVLSGEAEERLCTAWLDCIPDWSEEARKFNSGGILEVLANPDRCHDYLANYCRKLSQKTLPPECEPPGRWWWISDAARPVPRGTGIVCRYDHDRPMRMLRDTSKIEIVRCQPSPEMQIGLPIIDSAA